MRVSATALRAVCLGVVFACAGLCASADDGPLATDVLSVKSSDITIGTSQVGGAPDAFGGFEIRVTLPQSGVAAENCATGGIDGGLSLVMGDVTPDDPQHPSVKDRNLISAQLQFYNKLLAAKAANATIHLIIKGNATYLKRIGSKTIFPYCSAGMAISG